MYLSCTNDMKLFTLVRTRNDEIKGPDSDSVSEAKIGKLAGDSGMTNTSRVWVDYCCYDSRVSCSLLVILHFQVVPRSQCLDFN